MRIFTHPNPTLTPASPAGSLMPLKIKLYDARTTTAQFSGNSGGEMTIGGYATGLAHDPSITKETALHEVLAALEDQEGITLFPNGSPLRADPAMVLSQVLLTGMSHDAISFQLRYSVPGGAPASALILEVDSSLQSVQRDKYPASNIPIWVGWQGRATESGPTSPISPRIPRDTAPFTYLRPIVRVSAYLLRAGSMDEATAALNAGYIGTVNDAPWLGKPRGCWLMTGYKSSMSRYAGFYSVRAEAVSKGGSQDAPEDYRVLDVLRNRQSGRIAVPDGSKIQAAVAAPYAFREITKAANGSTIYNPDTDGFIVHGPYVPISFPSLWSILIK